MIDFVQAALAVLLGVAIGCLVIYVAHRVWRWFHRGITKQGRLVNHAVVIINRGEFDRIPYLMDHHGWRRYRAGPYLITINDSFVYVDGLELWRSWPGICRRRANRIVRALDEYIKAHPRKAKPKHAQTSSSRRRDISRRHPAVRSGVLHQQRVAARHGELPWRNCSD